MSFQQIKDLLTIAATGLVALQLPALPHAKRVVSGADNDQNDAGLRAALNAGQRWSDERREISIESPRGVKDWNDVLQRGFRQTGLGSAGRRWGLADQLTTLGQILDHRLKQFLRRRDQVALEVCPHDHAPSSRGLSVRKRLQYRQRLFFAYGG